jgi:hypothetical protein
MTMRIDHSLRPDPVPPSGAAGTPAASPCCEDHGAIAADELSRALDDATVAYVLATRKPFDGLRQAASQLAGLLVLAASGAHSITQEHAMLDAARKAHAEAADGLASATVSARARHHHRHLVEAAQVIGIALERATDSMHDYAVGRRDVDAALSPLKAGYRHLQWAAAALPGFELIDFQGACCAVGAPAPAIS